MVIARHVYCALLRLYPDDYRDRFAGEMLEAFQEAAGEHRGYFEYVHFLLTEFRSLISGAAADRWAKWTTRRSLRWSVLPDVRLMRPPEITREVWAAGLSRRRRS